MLAFDDCILGNRPLHETFIAATRILGKLLADVPDTVSMEELIEHSDCAAEEAKTLCERFCRAGIIQAHGPFRREWSLAEDAHRITLEDVFRIASACDEPRSPRHTAEPLERVHADVELLIMQATLAVNQSVFKHLRQFSLDCLKVAGCDTYGSIRLPMRVLNEMYASADELPRAA